MNVDDMEQKILEDEIRKFNEIDKIVIDILKTRKLNLELLNDYDLNFSKEELNIKLKNTLNNFLKDCQDEKCNIKYKKEQTFNIIILLLNYLKTIGATNEDVINYSKQLPLWKKIIDKKIF